MTHCRLGFLEDLEGRNAASLKLKFCVLVSWPNPSTGNVTVDAPDWLALPSPPPIGRREPRSAVIGPAHRTGSVISSGSVKAYRGSVAPGSIWLKKCTVLRLATGSGWVTTRSDPATHNPEPEASRLSRRRGCRIQFCSNVTLAARLTLLQTVG